MAKYKKGISGPASGKFGSIIASSWREVDYFKSVGRNFKKDPSEKQLLNRARFKLVHRFLALINSSVQLAFISNPGKRTGRNAAQSHILTEACILTDTGWKLDYSKILVSFGSLAPVKDAAVEIIQDGVTIKWNKKAPNNEQMIIAMIDPEKGLAYERVAEANRSAGEYTLELDDRAAPSDYHIYLGTVSIDRKQASNSVYLGCIQYPLD